jgi:hypothetical protein
MIVINLKMPLFGKPGVRGDFMKYDCNHLFLKSPFSPVFQRGNI